jgi:hypothetical protein
VRELAYSSPNLLFALLNSLSVRAQVEAESVEALRRLKQAIEAGPRASSQRRGGRA